MMKRTNFLLPVLVVLTACAPLASAFGADDSRPPAAAGGSTPASQPPIVVQNSDGTITAQTTTPAPAQPGAKRGLVIPPQIIVPIDPSH